MEIFVSEGRVLQLMVGDITKVAVDAMANAANSGLRGGGGVDGAIHRAGGPAIMRELDQIRAKRGGCPTGQAVATSAGRLPAKWVFHAVGPVYEDGSCGEADALRGAYLACMALAEEKGARTISFPAISTGIYGYPLPEAAEIALSAVQEALRTSTTLERAIFVLFNRQIYDEFAAAASKLKPAKRTAP